MEVTFCCSKIWKTVFGFTKSCIYKRW